MKCGQAISSGACCMFSGAFSKSVRQPYFVSNTWAACAKHEL